MDDLFIDLFFYIRSAYRKIFVLPKYPKLKVEDLRKAKEQSVAIFIPAWHEESVIGRMLENTIRWLDYRNYEIFIGTYPNDEGTLMTVAKVQEAEARVHRVVTPKDGPTNKADCLNWVYEGMLRYEKESGKRFEIIVIHDAEDIVHPLSLKLLNYLIPRMHMVQIPVVPLEMPLTAFTAGTYLDEFAEFHTKDLLVRERVCGMVPSAGVGTGFSREAIDLLAEAKNHQLFNVNSFTEDYDFGFRIRDLQKKSILLQFEVERTQVIQAGWFRKHEKLITVKELVATREFFPSHFEAAVRQKSRWVFGIVFQGWQQIGWKGDKGMRYMLWRDRKALFSNFINIYGYVVLLTLGAFYMLTLWETAHGRGREIILVRTDSWLWTLVLADTALMFNRMAQRAISVARVSTWQQSVVAVPRVFWANVINFCAVARATKTFWHTNGDMHEWAKTEHVYPTEKQLVEFKRKLGDLLLESRLLSLDKLSHALQEQKTSGDKLGDVLLRLGYVNEDDLVHVLAAQLGLDHTHVHEHKTDEKLVKIIPEDAARQFHMIALAEEEGIVLIAAIDPKKRDMLQWLDAHLGRKYRVVIGAPKRIMDALSQAYAPQKRKMLGELLLESGVITTEQLQTALEEQKRTGKRLGEVLETLGFITPELLAAKIAEQQGGARPPASSS